MAEPATDSFLVRNEFLIRRLHSLSGLVPVGAFMCVHLAANASVLAGSEVYQKSVDSIQSLGPALPVVEWVFIFIPILFHAIFGFVIIGGGLPNTGNYPLERNIRYTLQRATGMIAFVYIIYHMWHMHHYGVTFGGGNFDPEHATSSAAAALTLMHTIFYVVGMLSCVYHLANGLWTMGITWGVWTSPAAQRRADVLCSGFGVALAILGLSAVFGFNQVDVEKARATEERLIKVRQFEKGEIDPAEFVQAEETPAEEDK